MHVQREKLTRREAFKRFWRYLIPMMAFPTVAFAGTRVGIPFWILIPFFFAATFYASLPTLKGEAPYSFWTLATWLWLLAGIVAALLVGLIDAACEFFARASY
ncbi:MAG: hypothetical protein JSR82_16300 [Verrucomicrobia bacterium]|nr:hypothetical protein [Verrucomicrobiota bacterium]